MTIVIATLLDIVIDKIMITKIMHYPFQYQLEWQKVMVKKCWRSKPWNSQRPVWKTSQWETNDSYIVMHYVSTKLCLFWYTCILSGFRPTLHKMLLYDQLCRVSNLWWKYIFRRFYWVRNSYSYPLSWAHVWINSLPPSPNRCKIWNMNIWLSMAWKGQ